MRRLPVSRHRTTNQVRAAYRACRDGVAKTRWHAIWLLLRTDVPRTPAQVAEVVGMSVISVRAAPVERTRPRGADRPTGHRPGAPPALRRATRGVVRRPPEATARRRVVERSEGGPVRRRPVGRCRAPGDRLAVGAGAGFHP